jgi:hypothetical protein
LVRELGEFRVPFHPGVNEWAGRENAEASLAGVFKCGSGERAADALALVRVIDHRVRVHDQLACPDVFSEAGEYAVEMGLESVAFS